MGAEADVQACRTARRRADSEHLAGVAGAGEAGVTAVVEGPQGREAVRCRHVVGADGGASKTRHLVEIDFPAIPTAPTA